MAVSLPKDLATALTYSPGSQQQIQRSQYLADALKEIGKPAPITGGATELGARLLALAITQRASKKANADALGAINADRKSFGDSLISSLSPAAPAEPAPAPMASPQPAMTAAPLASAAPLPQAPQASLAASLWPALERQESGGNQAAVSPAGAFGVAQLMPGTAAEMAAKAGNPALAGQARTDPDVNRQLGQAYLQQQMDTYQVPEMALAAYNAGPGRVDDWVQRFGDPRKGEISPADWAAKIPFPETRDYVSRVLSGATPSPAMGAAQPLPAAGAPASAPMSPQVGAGASGGAFSPSGAPPVDYWRPTPAQVDNVRKLLADPRTYDQGVQIGLQIQQKMQEPIEYVQATINGLPFYVPKDPSQRATTQPIPVPQGAMTQVLPAQAAGIASAPQGVYVQRDPLGNIKEVPGAPPQGYQISGQGYAPVQGGPADPMRRQAPAQGYEWRGGTQAPIAGGPNDPQSPTAVFEGTKGFRAEIAPVLNQATQLKRNVDSVRQGYAQQNGPGDIAMVNGLQRLIDEGVVREGDVALQLKGQGIPGGLAGLKGYMTGEGFFADPAVRKKVLNAAESLYGEINGTYRERVMGYRSIADRIYGPGAFENYVLPGETAQALGWGGQAQTAPAAGGGPASAPQLTPGSVDAGIAAAVQRGLTNTLSPQQLARARELGLIGGQGGAPAAPQGSSRVRRYNPQTGRLEP